MSGPAHRKTEYFVWPVEGKHISIHLSVEAARRLRPATPPPNGVRADECGGILLGYAKQIDGGYMVAVEDFEPVECEHVRGASWILSRRDRQMFARAVKRLKNSGGHRPGVIGFYRTHTRPGTYLDEHDFELFREHFSHPASIALVIRPDAVQASAGFFFWEDGDIQRARPYKSFPFTAAELARSAAPLPVPEPERKPVAVSAGRRAFLQWRKPALLLPVAAGLAFGLLWDPKPLRRTERVHVAAAEPREHANVPDPSDVVQLETPAQAPETSIYTPPPEDPGERVVRRPAVQSKNVRSLVVPPVKRRVLEPVLDVQAPVITASARFEGLAPARRQSVPRAAATVEPVKVSGFRRAVGSIPGLGFLKRRKHSSEEDYVAAHAVREFRPPVPAGISGDTAVSLRLSVGRDGSVDRVELLSRRVDPLIAETAVDAARKWRFAPATVDEKPVASEMILHFRFGAAEGDGT